jgi:hypothetical protein
MKLLALPLILSLALVGCGEQKKADADYKCVLPDGTTERLAPDLCKIATDSFNSPTEVKQEVEPEVPQAEAAQAQQWLNAANPQPTWSGAQFEENRRQAWAECEKDPSLEGC